MDITVPSSLQRKEASCSKKHVYTFFFFQAIETLLGKKFFFPLVLAYWLLFTFTKSKSQHKKDTELDLCIDLRLDFSVFLVFPFLTASFLSA